ncbi:MAG: NPCBM/NEW2 domain-containing protein [Bacteroidales bacterium]
MKNFIFLLFTLAFSTYTISQTSSVLWLDELDLSTVTAGYGNARANKSVEGNPLKMGGKVFERGIGTHAVSTFKIDLTGCKPEKFEAIVGLDDEIPKNGSVVFYLVGDTRILWQSNKMHKGDKAIKVSVSLKGVEKLGLLVTDAGNGYDYDHADWAMAKIIYKGQKPKVVEPLTVNSEYLLTPPAPENPKVNGPGIYGVRPGSPFLYRIPATGKRPLMFKADGLPGGLTLDSITGIITGKIMDKGNYEVILTARNDAGTDSRNFKIVVGNTLALTPPMGWNSWYIHYNRVTDSLMRQSAYQLVKSGMADYGYQYVNIDDCWMVQANSNDPFIGGKQRDESGKLFSNKNFPDMKGLSDYIHSKGLKAGLYISPGPQTCAGYTGSYQHEVLDAETFAQWGFDFLKYDWCSYGSVVRAKTTDDYIAPYKLMWNALEKQPRDIVHNLCQYGMAKVWEWGATVGNCWRTTGDLGLESGQSMPGFYRVGISNARHWQFAKPGGWNDPDYILIGWVGAASQMGEGTKTRLTADEQYFYMSMWSLMAAPLIFSGDMARLDAFQLNILCNNEVIDINQDALGKQAEIARETKNELVLVKPLEDGGKAVGLFYITPDSKEPLDYFNWNPVMNRKITITASELGMNGKMKIRDVWRQKDLGVFENSYTVDVPYHGVMMLKITQIN